MTKLDTLSKRLADSRSRRVIFVAHCVLNENARYQGGAVRPGANTELLAELHARGLGIVQMKCPEQQAWGGILRPLMWFPVGWESGAAGLLRRLLMPAFRAYTRWAWGRIARQTVREIRDWVASGFEVVGIIGIAGSPSCGIERTLDLEKGAAYIAAMRPECIEREEFNKQGIRRSVVPGQGFYVEALRRELRRHGLDVPFFEHDLMAELEADRPMFFPSAVPGAVAPDRG